MKTLTLIITAACLLTAPRPAYPWGWTNDPINGFVTVCDAPGRQQNPEVCLLGGNNILVVWQDYRNQILPDTIRTYYQILNPFGMPLLETNGRPIFAGSWQFCSGGGETYGIKSVIPDGQGGCIIVVADWRNGAMNTWGQRIDSLGNKLWGENGLPLALPPYPVNANALAFRADSSGNYFLSLWIISGESHSLYCQKFRADGTVLWGAYGVPVFTILPDNQTDYQHPVPDMQGGLLECWVDYRLGYFSPRLYFQHLNAQGQPLLAVNGIPILDLWGQPLGTDLLRGGVPDGQGGGIWSSGPYLYLWRLDGMGHMRWSWVNGSSQGGSNMIRHPADGTIWIGGNYSGQPRLWRFTISGQPLFGETGLPYQVGILTPVNDGIISIRWSTSPWYNSALRVDSNGQQQWYSYITRINETGVPSACSDGADGAVMACMDGRLWPADQGNIIAQRVNADGTLGAPPKHQLTPAKSIDALTPGYISYVLEQGGPVKIELFDVLGRRIALLDQGWKGAGAYKLKWEIAGLASGVYLLRMEMFGQVDVRKVAVVR
jgi:hypothetical protein